MSELAAEPTRSRSPRRTILISLAVLALSWFAFPAPVASWVYDNCGEWPVCPAIQSAVDGVEAASRSVGVAGALETVRDNVRAFFGIEFY